MLLAAGDIFGAPLWFWAIFAASITGVLAFDLGYLNRRVPILSLGQSLALTIGYTALAVSFGLGVWLYFGAGKARYSLPPTCSNCRCRSTMSS